MTEQKLTALEKYKAERFTQRMFVTGEKITNEKGGSQSRPLGRADLLPPKALMKIATVLGEGCNKYGEWNWKSIESKEHLNHAIIHILAHIANDTEEPHIEHAATRILFALEMMVEENTNKA